MTLPEPSLVVALRLLSSVVAASVAGFLASWPLVALPAVSSAIGLNSTDRLRIWIQYHRRITPIMSLLMPLLTITLALSALFVQSDPGSGSAGAVESSVAHLVRENRKSLFLTAAILTLAHRPYAFSFLVPRQDILVEQDRKILMRFTGKSLSPVESEDEDDVLVGGFDPLGGVSEKTALRGITRRVDTDEVMRDLSNLQMGSVVLSTLTFVLTLVELVCV
ncbi:hypothetical protein JCM10212_000682 [Sporobolomyces blumeae]